MDKKNVISLVLGLVIGALAIWLVMSFTDLGSTMIVKRSTTPTPTTTASTGAANFDLSKVKTVDGVTTYTIPSKYGNVTFPVDSAGLNQKLDKIKNFTPDEIKAMLNSAGIQTTGTINPDGFWKWFGQFIGWFADFGNCTKEHPTDLTCPPNSNCSGGATCGMTQGWLQECICTGGTAQ